MKPFKAVYFSRYTYSKEHIAILVLKPVHHVKVMQFSTGKRGNPLFFTPRPLAFLLTRQGLQV